MLSLKIAAHNPTKPPRPDNQVKSRPQTCPLSDIKWLQKFKKVNWKLYYYRGQHSSLAFGSRGPLFKSRWVRDFSSFLFELQSHDCCLRSNEFMIMQSDRFMKYQKILFKVYLDFYFIMSELLRLYGFKVIEKRNLLDSFIGSKNGHVKSCYCLFRQMFIDDTKVTFSC